MVQRAGSGAARAASTRDGRTGVEHHRRHLPMRIEHILCAVDGSAPALRAVIQATRVARGMRSQLTIVSVRQTANAAAAAPPPDVESDMTAALSVAAETALQNGFEGVRTVQVSAPDAATAVADYARQYEAGLIFAGATGLHSTCETRFGSTCMNLLRQAPCPVTVVH